MPSTANNIYVQSLVKKYEKLFKVIKLKSYRTYKIKKMFASFIPETGLHSNFAQCCHRKCWQSNAQ